MARYALIKGGEVHGVIIADQTFFASVDPMWRSQYDAVREVVTESEIPETADAIVSRDCEPGALLVNRAATPEEIAAHDTLVVARRGRRDIPLDVIATEANVQRDLAMRAASGPRNRVIEFVRPGT